MPDSAVIQGEVMISELPAATAANATDQLEANQAGTSRSITVSQVVELAVELARLPVPPVAGDPAISLDDFITAINPLQAAFDFLGPNGGTITIPNREYAIPGQCVAGTSFAVSSLRTMALIGEGPGSALTFPNGGGIAMYFATPSGNEHASDQLVVKQLAIFTTQYTSTSAGGSGTGLAACFAVAVGDVTSGVTMRDVQVGNKSQAATSATTAQWWNTCIQLYNARQVTLANVYTFNPAYFTGTALPPLGTGIDLNGGTVEVQMSDINCAHHVRGVYVNGVCEGIQWTRGVTIGCTNGVWIDGDVDGRARSTSSTSQTIGTGSKTFTVAHNVQGPDGLAWTSTGPKVLTIRDTANPTVNTMTGAITAWSGNSVTVNVTATAGSGTINSWTLSPEHHVSQVVIDGIHCNNQTKNIYLRWTAFTNLVNLMMQPRDDGTTNPFWQIELAQENTVTFIDNIALSSLAATAQVKGGIALRGTYPTVWNATANNARNFYVTIKDIIFTESAFNVGLLIEANVASVDASALRGPGAFVSKMIDNQVTAVTANVKVYDCVTDFANTNAWRPFAANSTTPSAVMDGFNRFYTANSTPTTIASFVGGCVGEAFMVAINDVNTSIAHSASLLLRDAATFTPAAATMLTFMRETATVVREIGRLSPDNYMQNSATIASRIATDSATLNIVAGATSGTGSIEVSGGTAALIDLKVPTSDDFDIRLTTVGTGGNLQSAAGLGLYAGGAGNELALFTNAVKRLSVFDGSVFALVPYIVSAGGSYSFNTRSIVFCDTDGSLRLTSSATTVGVCLDFATDAVLKVRRRLNTLDADMTVGQITAMANTAIGAGANTQSFVKASTTANLGVYYGTGDPTFSAAKGSLYTKTDATTTTTRLWVNTTGSTTWASFTSSA